MIGIVYGLYSNVGWRYGQLGMLPPPDCGWLCNESFWLLPHVAQAMCWGEERAVGRHPALGMPYGRGSA